MIRSTKLEAKNRIRQYVTENTEKLDGTPCKTFIEAAYTIKNEFVRVMMGRYSIIGMKNFGFERFKEYAGGLPFNDLFTYLYNRPAKEILKWILDETDEEAERFNESQAEEKLTWFIYREINQITRN